jgi:hypothetical protein
MSMLAPLGTSSLVTREPLGAASCLSRFLATPLGQSQENLEQTFGVLQRSLESVETYSAPQNQAGDPDWRDQLSQVSAKQRTEVPHSPQQDLAQNPVSIDSNLTDSEIPVEPPIPTVLRKPLTAPEPLGLSVPILQLDTNPPSNADSIAASQDSPAEQPSIR